MVGDLSPRRDPPQPERTAVPIGCSELHLPGFTRDVTYKNVVLYRAVWRKFVNLEYSKLSDVKRLLLVVLLEARGSGVRCIVRSAPEEAPCGNIRYTRVSSIPQVLQPVAPVV